MNTFPDTNSLSIYMTAAEDWKMSPADKYNVCDRRV